MVFKAFYLYVVMASGNAYVIDRGLTFTDCQHEMTVYERNNPQSNAYQCVAEN